MKKLFIAILLSLPFEAQSQLIPVNNVENPDIASLGLYGSVPVSHFTGVPDISIPLYDVNVGRYSLPISISYHLAAVKPDAQYGILGLGWNLIAGGYITRSVNNLYDEKCSTGDTPYGYYGYAGYMNNPTDAQYDDMVLNNSTHNIRWDLSADDFYFNFCGYNGHFYYNPSGGWTVVSDQDIKVEFSSENGGFIRGADLSARIPMNDWTNRGSNDRFFNKFTLITPDGCQYEFGGLYATDYSISYYNRNSSDLIPTTWRLSKITTTDRREILFGYESQNMTVQCDLRYVPQETTITYGTNGDTYYYPQEGIRGMMGFLIFPARLTSISTDNEELTFNYAFDATYRNRFRYDTRVIYMQDYTLNRFDPYHGGIYNPNTQYFALLNASQGTTPDASRNNIINAFRNYMLSSIGIRRNYQGGSYKKIEFGYNTDIRIKLKSLRLRGWSSVSDTLGRALEYQFRYQTVSGERMDSRFVASATDSWGYYCGGNISLSSNPTYTLKPPVERFTKDETLTDIIYPTGGRTRFVYELNRYFKVVSDDRQSILSESGLSGGLRVSEIREMEDGESVTSIRKYYYTTEYGGNISSGILSGRPQFETDIEIPTELEYNIKSQGGFWPGGGFPSIVGYSTVFEDTQDSDGNSLGVVKYTYSNYDTDIYGVGHQDESYDHVNRPNQGSCQPFSSRESERGKLLSKEYYGPYGIGLKKRINYRYSVENSQFMVLSTQRQFVIGAIGNTILTVPFGWLTKVYTAPCLISEKADTCYSTFGTDYYSSKEKYTYNSHYLVSRVDELTSNGIWHSVSYTYPSDYSQYNWMYNNHILSPVVSRTVSESGCSIAEIYEFSNMDGIPYISRGTRTFGGNATKLLFEVNEADDYGNPIEVEADGKISVLYWGRKGQLFLGRIDNITLEEAQQNGYGSVYYESTSQNGNTGLEDYLYEVPNDAHIHAYQYNADNLLESSMIPTGFTKYYKYDGIGRLRETYHYDINGDDLMKRILEVYDYRYYNE